MQEKHFEQVAAPPLPVGAEGPIGPKQVLAATQTLQKYRAGKASLDARIVENEQWYKLRGSDPDGQADTAWLFNSLANKHADAMDNYPEPCVLPRAEDDREAAKALSTILPVALERAGYEQLYNDAWWYKLKHGTAAKGVFWNAAASGGLGEIEIVNLDLLNLFWEPGIRDIQQSRNLFHVQLTDNEELAERWPFARVGGTPSVETARYCYDDTVDTSDKSAVVDWYYHKNGRLHFCKYVNDIVLYASENDPAYALRGYYDHGRYPVVLDTLFPVAGSPCGLGYIDLMKGCQGAIDSLNRRILENADLAARPRYFVRGDGSVNEEEFADRTRAFVHVDGNLAEDSLRRVEFAPLADIYVAILNNKIEELKETSGNRDFGQGSTTSGVTAASAIAALQEAGSKLSRDALKSAYRAFTGECYLCIELMRQFYTAPRCFRITGQGGQECSFVSFSGACLRAKSQGGEFGLDLGSRLPIFDVTVSAAKKSTFSRLSQNELAQQFYRAGFFDPERADQSLACLSMMDFEGKDALVRRLGENAARARQSLPGAALPGAVL